jgi:hypothetical protein
MLHASVCAAPTTTCPDSVNRAADGAVCRPPHRSVHRAKQWGREQPPRFISYATPRVPGGLLTPRCRCRHYSRNPAAICAPFARVVACVHVADLAWIALHFRNTFAMCTRAASAITSRASICARPRQGSSLRSAPLRGPPGLDDACAQLEGRTYVMAEEARCIFHIDPSGRQTYREESRRCHHAPSPRSHPTRSAATTVLRATLQLLQQHLIDRAIGSSRDHRA